MTALAREQITSALTISSFAELASAIRLQGAVAMLWTYIDESGTHEDGRLVRMTIGGAIADVEAWKALEEDWATALNSVNRASLHMRELMLVPERDKLIKTFAGIIAKHTPEIIGYTSTVIDDTADMYEASFVDALLAVANLSAKVGTINVMAAKHPEFKRGARFFDLINWGDARLGTIAFGDPKDVLPLQAADLIAHQLRRGGDKLRAAGCGIYRWVDGQPRVE